MNLPPMWDMIITRFFGGVLICMAVFRGWFTWYCLKSATTGRRIWPWIKVLLYLAAGLSLLFHPV
jgi:hypothetical protein